jgi:dephospho-CoA kinase
MKKIINYLETKLIAVTGGIGCGQTTVCEYFKSLGCKVINMDDKAKQVIHKDINIQKELKKAFGKSIFDKTNRLDNKKLADIVFVDEGKVDKLNKIIHPRMIAEVIEEMEVARFSRKYPLVIMDAALIFEVNIEQIFDSIIVVYADLEKRIERIKHRDGMSRNEIINRINRQIPLGEKMEWADYTIDNNGSIKDMKKQVVKIFEKLTDDIRTEKRIRI